MSSNRKLWQQATVFLEREHGAFVCLRQALIDQADALRRVDIATLDERQRKLELAIAETENTVYQRVKWQRETLPELTNFTWVEFWGHAPDALDPSYATMIQDMSCLGVEIKRRVAENQRYAASAQNLLNDLRDVQARVTSEKNDLYTARGTLSNQLAMKATVGGVR